MCLPGTDLTIPVRASPRAPLARRPPKSEGGLTRKPDIVPQTPGAVSATCAEPHETERVGKAMTVSTIWIDGHARVLDPAEDVDALRQQVIAAVQSGGGFADFRTDQHVVSVLITDSVRVRIETTEHDDDEPHTELLLGASAESDLDGYLNYG